MRNRIGILILAVVTLVISACSSTSDYDDGSRVVLFPNQPPEVPEQERLPSPLDPGIYWRNKLGMNRAPSNLGFAERRFNPCEHGKRNESCGSRYLTVINFQLLCRDSVGTVQEAPTHMQPLTSGRVNWSIAGQSGDTNTDGSGFGQLIVLSPSSASGKRLTLRIGKQFLGFTASEMTRVILPSNFCS